MKIRLLRLIPLMSILTLLIALSFSVIHAQDNTVTLSISIPDFMRPMIGDDLFAEFESAHPGVKVHANYTGFDVLFPPSPAAGLDDYLAKIEELVSAADVVMVSGRNLSVEATRAGYFLDLTPLTSADSSLNVDDFIPATWDSFQWDGGVWGLPVSADVMTLIYDPSAFDTAGIAYPNENWTIEDFANAANTLAQRNADGTVTSPGMVTFDNTALLFRSLLGTGFYDSSVFPEAPSLNNPDLAALITRWAELESDGVVALSTNGDINSAPLRIVGSFAFQELPSSNEPQPQSSLLPGGIAGLDVQGVALSSGTQYPELAYELAKYLTSNTQFANGPFGAAPARMSLAGNQPTPPDDNGGGFVIAGRIFSPEIQALIDDALTHGLPLAELRFGDYVITALNKVDSDSVDAQTALQDVEASAVANLQAADDKRSTLSIIVTPPPPEVALQPGEVALNFGIQSFINPMPNLDEWQQLAQEFADTDPQVGKVALDTSFGNVSQFAERDDCFYLPYNAVPGLDPATVLNLDPFVDADPTFDKSDFIGNTLAQVQLDNKTYAFPMVVMPQILRYQGELLASAGVTVPENGWTIDSFVDALHTLKDAYSDKKPLEPRDPGGSYLLLLIAAFGGVPLDYRTSPPTINFTDPASVEAIRQALDLAKQDYIDYQEMARTQFFVDINGATQDLIHTEALNGGIRFIIGGAADVYKMALYPSGHEFSAVSYDIGTAYISATTQNAEACYRWLSLIAQHPDLLSAMPARRSFINDPDYAASQGTDVIAAYKQLDAVMQDPNTVFFPTPFAGDGGSPANFIVQFWLNRAFDHYVLEDADLDAELQDAQTYASAFLECVANLPPFDPSTNNDKRDFFQQYIQCAVTADPSASELFPTVGA